MTEIEAKNLKIVRRFVEQFLGRGDMSIAPEVLDEKVQVITGLKPTGPIDGIEEYQQVFSSFFDAFPPVADLVIEDIFTAGDRVVVRFKSQQKHAKEFFGVAATNREISFQEAHIMRLQDGKIVENIVSATNLEFEMLMAPVLTPMILR
jgi:predicted ester cyclase